MSGTEWEDGWMRRTCGTSGCWGDVVGKQGGRVRDGKRAYLCQPCIDIVRLLDFMDLVSRYQVRRVIRHILGLPRSGINPSSGL